MGVVGRSLPVGRQRVEKRGLEAPERHRQRTPPAERHDDERQVRAERGETREHAARRGRVHGDAAGTQTAVEQQLNEQAAEGMADENGRLGQGGNERRVMVDDLADTGSGESRVRRGAEVRDRPVIEGTAARGPGSRAPRIGP